MNPLTLLALLSVLGAAALFVALAVFLHLIIRELTAIGGTPGGYGTASSFLSKIRLGVRAIETQTGALPVQVTRLNEGLTAIRNGVSAIDANLAGVIDAVTRQEKP